MPATLPVPSTSTDYDANYELKGLIVVLNGNGNRTVTVASSSMPPLQTAPVLVYPVMAALTFSATAPSGQIVQSLALARPPGTNTVTGSQSTLTPSNGTLTERVTATPATITGVNIQVNGSPVTTNGTVNWANGSNNSLVAPARVDVSTMRYSFSNWSTGANTPALMVNNFAGTPNSLMANYTPSHYQLCVTMPTVFGDPAVFQISPPTGIPDGLVTGKPECSWRPAGSTATITVLSTEPQLQTRFSVNGAPFTTGSNTRNVTMNGPQLASSTSPSPETAPTRL